MNGVQPTTLKEVYAILFLPDLRQWVSVDLKKLVQYRYLWFEWPKKNTKWLDDAVDRLHERNDICIKLGPATTDDGKTQRH